MNTEEHKEITEEDEEIIEEDEEITEDEYELEMDIIEIIEEASEVVIDIIGSFESETDALMWLKKLFITVGATNTKEYIEKVNQLQDGTEDLLLDFVNHVKEISKNLDGEELTYDEVKDIVYDLFAVKNTLEEIDPEDDEAAEEIMELIKKVEEAISEEYQKPEQEEKIEET